MLLIPYETCHTIFIMSRLEQENEHTTYSTLLGQVDCGEHLQLGYCRVYTTYET